MFGVVGAGLALAMVSLRDQRSCAALLLEERHPRFFGRLQTGDQDGHAELSLPERVRSERLDVRLRGGVIRQADRAAEPLAIAGVSIEVQKRVGTSGRSAAEVRRVLRLL